jgi:uncharacterized membrane protein
MPVESVASEDGEFTSPEQYRFKWLSILFLLTQALPNIIGLLWVTYAFKFALLAQINQGCVVSMFSMTSVYIALIFYLQFGETFSRSKLIGLLLMTACIACIAIEST